MAYRINLAAGCGPRTVRDYLQLSAEMLADEGPPDASARVNFLRATAPAHLDMAVGNLLGNDGALTIMHALIGEEAGKDWNRVVQKNHSGDKILFGSIVPSYPNCSVELTRLNILYNQLKHRSDMPVGQKVMAMCSYWQHAYGAFSLLPRNQAGLDNEIDSEKDALFVFPNRGRKNDWVTDIDRKNLKIEYRSDVIVYATCSKARAVGITMFAQSDGADGDADAYERSLKGIRQKLLTMHQQSPDNPETIRCLAGLEPTGLVWRYKLVGPKHAVYQQYINNQLEALCYYYFTHEALPDYLVNYPRTLAKAFLDGARCFSAREIFIMAYHHSDLAKQLLADPKTSLALCHSPKAQDFLDALQAHYTDNPEVVPEGLEIQENHIPSDIAEKIIDQYAKVIVDWKAVARISLEFMENVITRQRAGEKTLTNEDITELFEYYMLPISDNAHALMDKELAQVDKSTRKGVVEIGLDWWRGHDFVVKKMLKNWRSYNFDGYLARQGVSEVVGPIDKVTEHSLLPDVPPAELADLIRAQDPLAEQFIEQLRAVKNWAYYKRFLEYPDILGALCARGCSVLHPVWFNALARGYIVALMFPNEHYADPINQTMLLLIDNSANLVYLDDITWTYLLRLVLLTTPDRNPLVDKLAGQFVSDADLLRRSFERIQANSGYEKTSFWNSALTQHLAPGSCRYKEVEAAYPVVPTSPPPQLNEFNDAIAVKQLSRLYNLEPAAQQDWLTQNEDAITNWVVTQGGQREHYLLWSLLLAIDKPQRATVLEPLLPALKSPDYIGHAWEIYFKYERPELIANRLTRLIELGKTEVIEDILAMAALAWDGSRHSRAVCEGIWSCECLWRVIITNPLYTQQFLQNFMIIGMPGSQFIGLTGVGFTAVHFAYLIGALQHADTSDCQHFVDRCASVFSEQQRSIIDMILQHEPSQHKSQGSLMAHLYQWLGCEKVRTAGKADVQQERNDSVGPSSDS